MSYNDPAIRQKIETLTRKQAYKALLEKGAEISKKSKQIIWRNFINFLFFR